MKQITGSGFWLAGLLAGWLLAAPARAEPFAWKTAAPESQGMDRARLDALQKDLAARGTRAFLVVRNDKIVYEWYADGSGPDKVQGTASLAKALVGGVALAVGLTDGRVSLDDPVARHVPQWKDDPQKAKVKLRHLGSHTSGLSDAEQDGLPHQRLTGWKGAFWKQLPPPDDPFTLARDQAPVLFEPGSRLQYSNPGIAMLTYALAAALRDAPEKNVRTLLRDRVLRPLGVPDASWSVGYGKTFTVDGLPLIAAWGGAGYTPRAAARVGRLLLGKGDWDGRRLLSPAAVRQVTTSAGLPGHCGMGFWTNGGGRYARLPRDAYWGAGAGDQVLLVVPSLNLIMVRNGTTLAPPPKGARDVFEAYHDEREKILFEPLIEAVVGRSKSTAAPYPASRVISGVSWAPAETIVRRAHDSDNWPMTWADDGNLYTAYGDGTGFVPKVPRKLSLGLARVEGMPPEFTGVNIRSATAEHKGDGRAGKKASGLLMVDGVLYMWVRNAGNAQLAWSTDHARTWAWSDWKFTTSFGYPAFLNFGQNYAGARDGYVYVYSHDSDSAYRAADRVVLARVPADKVRQRDAYEFYRGPGPLWTRDVNERGAVFTNPGRCYRVSASYNAALKRYLLCQAGDDGPVQAGFGLFDAPEPWGPWTTVYYMEAWDVRPGEAACLPTKWMSADGKVVHLVFSGGDRLNVRKALLTVEPAPVQTFERIEGSFGKTKCHFMTGFATTYTRSQVQTEGR
jgi:CubicO group peptidase (beta-lactamase class C family)